MYGHLRQKPPPGWVRMIETLNNGDHYAKVPRAKSTDTDLSVIFVLIGPLGMTTMLVTIFCGIWCKNRQKHMRKQVRHENRDLELRMKELTDRHFQADAKLERGMRGRQHRFSFGFSWNKDTEEEKVRQQEALEEFERTGAPPPEPINVRTSFFARPKRDEVSKFEGGQDEKIDDAKVEEIS